MCDKRTDRQTDWTIHRAARSQPKTGFKIDNKIEDQSLWSPILRGILTVLICIFGAKLDILTSIGVEWSRGQAKKWKLWVQAQFYLEGQGQPTPKPPNLVILVWKGHKLSRGQAKGWHTDGRMDTHTQTETTTVPEGQNWPWVKTATLLGHRQDKALTHWGRVTHICVSEIIKIGSDNGLSPGRRQAIIWTNAGILLIGPLGINFSEILIEINTVLFNKCIWKCRLRSGVYFVPASMC